MDLISKKEISQTHKVYKVKSLKLFQRAVVL